MQLSAGWYPTPQDPDNAGMAPMAEPFCPKCDGGTTPLDELIAAALNTVANVKLAGYDEIKPHTKRLIEAVEAYEASLKSGAGVVNSEPGDDAIVS
jgi:hypothetical protein